MSKVQNSTNLDTSSGMLRKNALGVMSIVFFVIAGNGPMTALLGALPAAIVVGNGVGTVGTIIVVGLIYLLFSVGFTAMGRHVKNAGAFYAYVGKGLGRPMGVGSAFLALLAYITMQLACYAMFGFFGNLVLKQFLHLDVPWWLLDFICLLLVAFCGYKNIELSGKILSVLMILEILIVLVFDIGVLAHGGGPEGFSLAPFAPHNVFKAGFGSSLVFIICFYMGFETTAIYSEEARDSSRTIPQATYLSVLAIAVIYTLSTWCIENAYGVTHIVKAAGTDPGNLWYTMTAKFVHPITADIMMILLVTSLFSALINFHNSTSRYFYSLGREKILWNKLGITHATEHTPTVAGFVNMVIVFITILIVAVSKSDPMATLLPIGSGYSAISMVLVQVLTSLAVIGFFKRNTMNMSLWHRMIAPTLSFIALASILVVMINNIPLLTGYDTMVTKLIPYEILLIGLGGVIYTLWLRKNKTQLYQELGRVLEEM